MTTTTAVRVRALWGEVLLEQRWVQGDFAVGEGRAAVPLVVTGEEGPELRLGRGMRGRVRRGGAWGPLPESDRLPLGAVDVAEVELGHLRFEVCTGTPPPRVRQAEALDADAYRLLNVLLVLLLLAGFGVVSANAWSEQDLGDAPPPTRAQLEKVRLRAAELIRPPARIAAAAAEAARSSAQAAPPRSGAASRAAAGPARGGTPRRGPQERASALLGGVQMTALLQGAGGVRALQTALDGVKGSSTSSVEGLGGPGSWSPGTGGGGDLERSGIGTVGIPGGRRDGQPGGTEVALGGGPKAEVTPNIRVGAPVLCDGRDPRECGLDRDLVRKVIDANRGQIRFCYEQAMVQAPALAGKVAVRFVIGEQGGVLRAQLAESTVGHPEMERCLLSRVGSWQFPKPRGGGQVVVTYPFLFRPSGG